MTGKERRTQELNELLNARPAIRDCDAVDPDDIMARVVAWDYERLLRWFCGQYDEIVATLDAQSIRAKDGEVVVRERSEFGTVRR